MLTRRTLIYAGMETTYGTLATGTTPLLAWDVEIDEKGEVLKRSTLRDTLSAAPHVVGMKEASLSFKTEIKAAAFGAGVGTNPEMAKLLQGCGFSSAAQTGSGAQAFALVSDEASVKSLSLAVYKDGNRHILLGARGNVKFVFEAGKYAVAEWEFSGLYGTVTAIAFPDATGITNVKPPIVYAAGFQIGGYSPCTTKAQIDVGNKVARRDSLNATYGVQDFRIASREGKLEFDADAVLETSNPFWGDWAGNICDTYSILLAGNSYNTGALAASQERVLISGYFQYETNKYGDADGISQYECVASLCSSDINSGNDEIAITFGYTAAA